MDRQLSKIMNVLLMALLLWFAFSFLRRISSLLPIGLTWFAILNVVAAVAIREFPGTIAKLGQFRYIRGYLKFVCHMIGDELPTHASASTPKTRLLLRTPKEYMLAADQAKQNVRGQDEVIDDALMRIRENQALRQKRRDEDAFPLASFFLVGHEGTGKRYMARVLSKLIFGTGVVDVFDCSRIDPATLLGTNDQPGDLIQLIRQRSYRTILFERVEKADEETSKSLINIISRGKIRLPGARKSVGFDNTLIYFTTTQAVSQLQSLADKQSSGITLPTSSIELLENETGIDRALLNAVTDSFLFQAPTIEVKAEVLSLLLQKECRSHDVRLAYVEPAILASQVCRIDDQNGFRLAPQLANRLLRKPLIAAAAANQTSLALRVRSSQQNSNEHFNIG